MKKIALALLPLLAASQLTAQPWTAELDSVLTLLAQQEVFNGQVAIAEGGRVQFSGAYGLTRNGDSITTGTPIDIQSVTKGITALSVMMLYEDGKLDINDPIKKYFPLLDYPDVQVKHLMNHTSGMPRLFEVVFSHWPHDQFLTLEGMVDLAVQQKLKRVAKPGESEEYNQTAYILLANIVEQVSGQPFTQFVRKNIFEPADMRHSWFNSEKADYRQKLGPANIDNLFALMEGDGNVQASAEDLARLDQAICSGKLIGTKWMELSYQPATLDKGEGHYGYGGALVEKAAGKRQFQHIGQGTTSNAVFTRYIDSGKVLVVLHDQSVQYAFPVYMAIKNIWEGQPYELPAKRVVHTISPELIKKYVGDYGDNGFMHLTTENGKLYIQPDGNPGRMEIVPSSNTTFYFEDQAVDWEIYLDADGNVVGFGPAGRPEQMMERQN